MLDLLQLTLDFQQWKVTMLDATGLAKDALHVHIGLVVFVVTRLAWRWRLGWLVAWLVALAFAAGGEWFDMRLAAAGGPLQPDEGHWHDMWNTMLWPTVLALVGRWLEPRDAPKVEKDIEISGKDAEQPLEQA